MKNWCSIYVPLFAFLSASASGAQLFEKVTYLEPGKLIEVQPAAGLFESNLRIFCYKGSEKALRKIFESVELHLKIENENFDQYEGHTAKEVKERYNEHRSIFSFSLFSQKKTRLHLSPFEQQCIGIDSKETYRLRLRQHRVDFKRILQLIFGLGLFTYASRLSRNPLFYYIVGICLGICTSFMLLIWLTSKLVPRRPMMYGVLIGGWTIGIYIIQKLLENLQVIFITYRAYVFWYILVTGFASFVICYRIGPPKNERSRNIIKWLLQLTALGIMFYFSRYEEASVVIIIGVLFATYVPCSIVFRYLLTFYRRRFPPKRRLLTNEEYYEEGVRETTKALTELRQFVSSPTCNQWKVVSKLKDPMRFASFAEGDSHLSDNEILEYEYFINETEYNLDLDNSESETEIVEQSHSSYALPRRSNSVSPASLINSYNSPLNPTTKRAAVQSSSTRIANQPRLNDFDDQLTDDTD